MSRIRNDASGRRRWTTSREVAEAANVSLITVSRAFKAPDLLLPETLKKVRAVADRLGYIPNASAGQLVSQRSRVVAVAVPTLMHSNFAQTLEGLAAGLAEQRYEILLSPVGFSPEREAEIVLALLEKRPDGVVLIGNDHTPQLKKVLQRARIPVVELWTLEKPIIDMAVGFSDSNAMQAITEHLIERGRKRIGYIDFHAPNVRRYVERRKGFQRAMRNAGLSSRLVVRSPSPRDYHSGRAGLAELLQKDRQLDAAIGCTDIHAAGAIFQCLDVGISIPGGVAVAGFGDFEIAAEIPPGLSTVRSHAREMGLAAARMLLNRIAGGASDAMPRDVGFELVIRGST